jgi:hypothetical protein
MTSQEIFYLHIQGEQRGPYTIRHIDHLLNSGLISEETLFWREGLEQWQPVTNLVARRAPQRSWKGIAIGAGIAVMLALLLHLFGPITVAGWRETNQHEFTSKAAYWRARDVVRNQAVPKGALVAFHEEEKAEVKLRGDAGANVLLQGELTEQSGRRRPATWHVELRYDRAIAEWVGVLAREAPGGL